MKLFKLVRKYGAVVAGVAVASAARAAVPTTVTDSITTAGTDAATIGAAVLVVIVGITAFMWLRRPLK